MARKTSGKAEMVAAAHKPVLPPFAALRAFEAVGRLGSLRKAAAELSIDHAVVGRHVNALEAWCAVRLVERAGNGRRLTPEGERFHARLSESIAGLFAAVAEVTGSRRATDRVSIWSNGGLASKWLGPELVRFGAEQSRVRLEVRPTDEMPDFATREADVDIRFFGDDYSALPADNALRRAELCRPPILVVGSPQLVGSLQGQAAANLLGVELLHEEHDAQWRAWFKAHGVVSPDELPGPRLWHAQIAISAAVAGKGLALASRLLVADELRDGTLAILSPDGVVSPPILGGYLMSAPAEQWTLRLVSSLRERLTQRMRADAL